MSESETGGRVALAGQKRKLSGSDFSRSRCASLIDFGDDSSVSRLKLSSSSATEDWFEGTEYEDGEGAEDDSRSSRMISLLDRANRTTPLIRATDVPADTNEARARRLAVKRKPLSDCQTVALLRPYVPMLQDFIRRHVETLPEKQQVDGEAVLQHVMPVWSSLMANLFHRYDLPNDAAQCSEECLRKKYTCMLYGRTFLSCCWVHGYLHNCEKEVATCRVRYTTSDLSILCIHGGRSLGQVMMDGSSMRGEGGATREKLYKYYKGIEKANGMRDTAVNEDLELEDMLQKMSSACDEADIVDTWDDATDIVPMSGRMPEKKKQEKEQEQIEKFLQLEREVEAQKSDAQRKAEEELREAERKVREARERLSAAASDGNSALPAVSKQHNSVAVQQQDENAENAASGAPTHRATIATKADLRAVERKENAEKAALSAMRKKDMANSKQVQALKEQALRVGGASMRAIIVQVMEDLLFGFENRCLYNRFFKGCLQRRAREDVRARCSNHLKRRSMVSFVEVQNILEHYNREYVEVIPRVERNAQQFERVYRRIRHLWELCCRSPHVRGMVKYEATAKKYVASPNGDDMCSLRQFTLAMMYYFRDGLTFAVPGSAHQDLISLIEIEDSFALELPPVYHVRFFGPLATRELHRRIENGAFYEKDFNPLASDVDSPQPLLLTRDTSRSAVRSRALSKTNVSMSRSLSLEASMNAVRNGSRAMTRRNRRRKAKVLAQAAAGERAPSLGSGRVKTSNGTCVTEAQLMPFYMREPMLSGGSRTTKIGVYDNADLTRAQKFVRRCITSYGSRISQLN